MTSSTTRPTSVSGVHFRLATPRLPYSMVRPSGSTRIAKSGKPASTVSNRSALSAAVRRAVPTVATSQASQSPMGMNSTNRAAAAGSVKVSGCVGLWNSSASMKAPATTTTAPAVKPPRSAAMGMAANSARYPVSAPVTGTSAALTRSAMAATARPTSTPLQPPMVRRPSQRRTIAGVRSAGFTGGSCTSPLHSMADLRSTGGSGGWPDRTRGAGSANDVLALADRGLDGTHDLVIDHGASLLQGSVPQVRGGCEQLSRADPGGRLNGLAHPVAICSQEIGSWRSVAPDRETSVMGRRLAGLVLDGPGQGTSGPSTNAAALVHRM